jgi:DNA-binding winged helix-turn-helix (wHTH) protein
VHLGLSSLLTRPCWRTTVVMAQVPALSPSVRGLSPQPSTQSDPLPVLVLRHGAASMRALSVLANDSRLELVVVDHLSPEWSAFAQRAAGTFVVTEGDPLNALVYAVSGGVTGPIIMMFAKRYAVDCNTLIDAGAADCVVTPVTKKDLDRVVSLLASTASFARVDGRLHLLLDPIARTARYHDKCIRLSQREFAVLQCLSSYHGRAVAAHKLLNYVWGERSEGTRPRQILDVYIFQLRRKLERLGLADAITTVRGLGYALSKVAAHGASSLVAVLTIQPAVLA